MQTDISAGNLEGCNISLANVSLLHCGADSSHYTAELVAENVAFVHL